MKRALIIVAGFLLMLPCGCGDSGTSDNHNNNAPCLEGYERQGRACVPVFDECPGSAEIPLLGGGCRTVGVTRCASGFASDGEGGCEPVLPADPCPVGTMEVLGLTDCQPVGVTKCATGFASDGEGGCDPVLPDNGCGAGTMRVLGRTTCRPIGDCGAGTWGSITVDASTVFVDMSYSGGNSDGSDASPFTTIGDALAAVEPGGQIAVAEGNYAERLIIDKPLRLTGRCPSLVRVSGSGATVEEPTVRIEPGGSGTTIAGLTMESTQGGILLDGATGVRLSQLEVMDTGYDGVWLRDGAQAELLESRVIRAERFGVASAGSDLQVRTCEIVDGVPESGGTRGRGIGAWCESAGGCGSLTVEDSVVAGNSDLGIFVWGADAEIARTFIGGTLSRSSDGLYGRGINAQCDEVAGSCGSLSVTDSVLAGNRDIAVFLWGVNGSFVRTVVRDTEGRDIDERFGRGINAQCHPAAGVCGRLSVVDSLVASNREGGIVTYGADVHIASTAVRDTLYERYNGRAGRGISAQCDADVGECGSLTLTGSLVSGNREVGVLVEGMDATMIGTVVKDTRAQFGNLQLGRGIQATCGTDVPTCGRLDMTGCVVAINIEVGVLVEGMDARIASTVVRDTMPRLTDDRGGWGIDAKCDAELGVCGTLTVEGSYVARNVSQRITVKGMHVTVASTVVRDTQPHAVDQMFGRGIEAGCQTWADVCGSLTVTDSMIRGNREHGISVFGIPATIESTVVRGTLEQEADGTFGRGINAQCEPSMNACGSLTVSSSLVADNCNVGIFVMGIPATLNEVAVVDTRPASFGPWQGDFGQSVFAMCDSRLDICGRLEVTAAHIASGATVGLAVKGVPGFIESSRIALVVPRPRDNSFGYGIQVEGLADQPPVVFDVDSCRIEQAVLAGILYSRGAGTLVNTAVGGGMYSVVASVGSEPEVGEDNDLTGIAQDGLYWGNMNPAAAPPPALPVVPE